MEHSATVIRFGPFRLVPEKKELWRDAELLKLRSMPLAVLTYLTQHPERVIPVEELRKAVWGGTRVGSGAIRVCVREIRQALGDEATAPHYIETVGRQGYRFVGYRFNIPLATSPPVLSSQGSVLKAKTEGQDRRLTTDNWQLATHFVGRERQLAQLQQWFAQAQQGQRQVVLVSGDPGIGKTTLMQQFVQLVAQPPSTSVLWVGHGQCVESYGLGEA